MTLFKSLALSSLLAATAFVSGCAPDPISSEENDLLVEPALVEMSGTTGTGDSGFRLVCGCPFTLTILEFTGDTNAIKYNIPNLGRNVNLYSVKTTAAPGVASGTYTAKLVAKGGVEGFVDTLTINLIVP